MASYATTRVATSEVIKAMDTRIDELQKLLASLKETGSGWQRGLRRRLRLNLSPRFRFPHPDSPDENKCPSSISVSQRRRLQMIRDDDDNYTLTVSRDELDLILAQLQIASAPNRPRLSRKLCFLELLRLSQEYENLHDRLAEEYNDLYREGDE